MASKKKKKNSNSYWMKYGGTPRKMWTGGRTDITGSGLQHLLDGSTLSPWNPQYTPGHQRGRSNPEREWDYVYENGGDPNDPITDPTFKAWFAKNARREDVMQSSSNPEALKQLFLTDLNMTQMPLFSGELDAYGNVDKSGRSLETSSKLIGGLTQKSIRDMWDENVDWDKLNKKYGFDVWETLYPEKLYDEQGTKREDYDKLIEDPIDDCPDGKCYENKRFGGRPKAEYGHKGYTSSPTDYTRDYSGIADRNPNMLQDIGAVGDTNMLQYIPVYGHALDLVADVIGFKGDAQQHFDNTKDAFAAQSTLGVLNKENINKGTLDLSTRTDALDALAGYQGYKPDLWADLMPEVSQNIGGYLKGEGSNLLAGTGTEGDIGDFEGVDIGDDKIVRYGGNPSNEWARYGLPNRMTLPKAENGKNLTEIRKRPGMGNAGKYPGVKKFAGPHGTYPINNIDRARSALKLAHHSSNPGKIKSNVYKAYPSLAAYGGTFGEDKIQKGRQEFESGMDLRNLRAFGGANMIGPQVGGSFGITPQLDQQNPMYSGQNFDPYSQGALFKSTGMSQSGFAQGGTANDDYEAEGGEVIMHEPGGQPATTGNLENIEDSDMLSKLQGSSHEAGGEEVSGDGEQYVFSKTLKSDSWKMNFAKAAEKIAKNISKYEKASDTGDAITKSTAEAMLQAWTQKLADLREEQEAAREEKFMEMVNSGASMEELAESFPDLTEQFMAEQQLQQQAGGVGGGMEQQAAMPANPMGDIDMSALSETSQQLVGAKYGLPQKQNGEFEPYDFSQWMRDEASITTDFNDLYQEAGLELGKDYMPNRGEFLDFLTLNAPEEGYVSDDELYEPKDYYNILKEQFGAARFSYLESEGIPTDRPKRGSYKTEEGKLTTEGRSSYQQDLAKYRSYNRGLPSGWDQNYGLDVGMSERRYWKSRFNSLMSEDDMTSERARRIVEQEKMQKSNAELAQLELDNKKVPLTEKEKAEQLLAQNLQMQKNKSLIQDFGTSLLNLSPTFYNFAQGNKKADVEQFVGNKYDSEILKELALLKDNRIDNLLDENEESFNMLKYMARQHGDGSSGRYMDLLLRGQNIKTDADAKAYAEKLKLDMTGGKIAAESLYNLGEKDRVEGVRVQDVNAQNEAARQAFTSKGWEGLSGYSQLQQKMKASAARDEELKGLLGQIYPDAEMYMDADGTIDIEKILKENPELKEIFIKYFKTW